MSVIIKIPQLFRKFINEEKEITVSPGSINEIIKEIKKKYPDLAEEIIDNRNHFKGYIKLCVNAVSINTSSEYSQVISDGQLLKLLIPISGG